jgi:hypothetical protein
VTVADKLLGLRARVQQLRDDKQNAIMTKAAVVLVQRWWKVRC